MQHSEVSETQEVNASSADGAQSAVDAYEHEAKRRMSASDADETLETPLADELPVTIIRPQSGWLRLDLDEVWKYRDLLKLLIWRNIAARYRQSVVGYGWAVIKPVLSMLIFTFVFGRVAGIDSGEIPYPLFAFSALLPWMYFAGAVAASTGSVVGGGALLKKVYFPKLILPIVAVVGGLVELSIQLVVLALLMVWFQVVPGLAILAAPFFVLMALATAFAAGLWLTAMNVKYRDVGMAIPFLTQAWMWLCPIVYPSQNVPEHLRPIYGLNPMAGVIDGFRWSVAGSAAPDWTMVGTSLVVVVVTLVAGLYYFKRTEASFADII